MRKQIDYYKSKSQSTKKQAQIEIIRLDHAVEEENEAQIIRKQDEQLENFHHSLIPLKSLTKYQLGNK
jgi:hypothetical protein